jgi:hypothetical protein
MQFSEDMKKHVRCQVAIILAVEPDFKVSCLISLAFWGLSAIIPLF